MFEFIERNIFNILAIAFFCLVGIAALNTSEARQDKIDAETVEARAMMEGSFR